jgi:hypothetical protein
VTHHVLAGRRDAPGQVRALQAAHVGDAECRGEVRVLAIGLLDRPQRGSRAMSSTGPSA